MDPIAVLFLNGKREVRAPRGVLAPIETQRVVTGAAIYRIGP